MVLFRHTLKKIRLLEIVENMRAYFIGEPGKNFVSFAGRKRFKLFESIKLSLEISWERRSIKSFLETSSNFLLSGSLFDIVKKFLNISFLSDIWIEMSKMFFKCLIHKCIIIEWYKLIIFNFRFNWFFSSCNSSFISISLFFSYLSLLIIEEFG